MSTKKLLTIEDEKRLKDELKHLIEVRKPQIIQQIQEAREQGDLSENADYDAAKNEQAIIEKRIAEINAILDNSEIINEDANNSNEIVAITKTVRFLDLSDNIEYEFKIVGSEGADPEKGKISNESPLAKSILNKKVGEEADIKGIENPYKVRILEIK